MRVFTLCVLAVTLTTQARVSADEDPDEEIARRHFEAGAQAYAQRDYARAIREFEAARQVRPARELDYNIARAYDRMERPEDAIVAYERFLGQAPDGDSAEEARRRVGQLRARVRPVTRSPVPIGALAGVGALGLASLAVGAGLLGSTAARFDELESTCKPACARESWDGLPLRRNLGIAFVAVAGAAALTEVVLLGVRLRGRR